MSARLVAVSKPAIPGLDKAEDLIAYVARVSNPTNQFNTTNQTGSAEKLLAYCVRHKHWSVFETASMTVEIRTTRAIAAQILRHRSFTFQEFSQRYAVVETDPEPQDARSQDAKNRQSSNDDLPESTKRWWERTQKLVFDATNEAYVQALEKGIAKECARFVLPLATPTVMYMTGNVRDWIHYIDLRTGNGTQREHAEIAEAVKRVFVETFPTVSRALAWT